MNGQFCKMLCCGSGSVRIRTFLNVADPYPVQTSGSGNTNVKQSALFLCAKKGRKQIIDATLHGICLLKPVSNLLSFSFFEMYSNFLKINSFQYIQYPDPDLFLGSGSGQKLCVSAILVFCQKIFNYIINLGSIQFEYQKDFL